MTPRIMLCLWLSVLYLCASAQTLELSNLQHEVRWLEEVRFPPYVKQSEVSDSMLERTARKLAKKFKLAACRLPEKVNYRLINVFGKTKFNPPPTVNGPDFHASVLSFLTRATTGFEVFWTLKVEVRQSGKTIFFKETKHELLNYENGLRWFTEESFLEHYEVLLEELLELRPAMAQKYVLGKGIDYAQVLRDEGDRWPVDRNANPLGFGQPVFGPYTTIDAGRLDTAVIRTKKVLGKETSVNISGQGVSLEQFKTYDFSKRKFCYLLLEKGSDTMRALFTVGVRSIEQRRTFLSDLLSKDDDSMEDPPGMRIRNVSGILFTGNRTWEFNIRNYQQDGTIDGGSIWNDEHIFQLSYLQHAGFHWEFIAKTPEGAYVSSLEIRGSGAEFIQLRKMDPAMKDALAAYYAVLLSARHVQ